jgi:predicted acyl esterase
VAPYGADAYKSTLGPSKEFQDEGFIFVYQDARGRYMSEGEFQQVRPYVPDKGRRRTLMKARTRMIRSSGC